ncbi:MAG: extracellular solute-binding protein [Clostridia bacterium]
MKKVIAILLALVMVLSCASCGTTEEPTVELEGNAKILSEGANLTHDELVAKAKAETGAFAVYATSSRAKDAGKKFTELYGIEVEATNVKDGEIYTKLETEISSNNTKGADVVMTQNGAVLKVTMIDTGYLLNYVPASIKGSVDAADQLPLVQQYINKLFMYNNVNADANKFKNVWQFTEAENKDKIFFKSPENETVNKNFLIMLTSDEWAGKLAKAYKELYGKDIVLGEFKNAGYKWVAEFLQNCSFAINSDTTIAKELSNVEAKGKAGLFVYSKLRSKDVTATNLIVSAFETITPFAGFMYPLYTMITKNTDRPYTSMLFVEHLMGAEGFAPWGKDNGAYSGNTSLKVNEDKGDKPLNFWKNCLVNEDPEYIIKATDVPDFISKYMGK